MTKQGKLVRQDADGIWLAPKLAASKTGVTKPELARLALAGELRFQDDSFGQPAWYAEPEIAELVQKRLVAEMNKPVRTKRQPTDAQIEKKHTKEWKEHAKVARYGGGGPVTAHLERMMLKETLSKAKAKREMPPAGEDLVDD